MSILLIIFNFLSLHFWGEKEMLIFNGMLQFLSKCSFFLPGLQSNCICAATLTGLTTQINNYEWILTLVGIPVRIIQMPCKFT